MRCAAGGCWVRPGLRNRTGGSPRGGGSCAQMLGVKEQPHKRWLISAGHGRPKRWSVARARHRFISPQSPRAGPCFGPRHGEVGCLPIQPGLQWPHAQPHPKDHLRRNARRWRSRPPDLLLGFPVRPLDRDQRRPMAGWRSALGHRAAVHLPRPRPERP
jgi:hypothetical protein